MSSEKQNTMLIKNGLVSNLKYCKKRSSMDNGGHIVKTHVGIF